MWTVKVKDALEKGEQEIQKILADIGKDAPTAEAVLSTVVTVFAPAEANALNAILTAANTLVTAFTNANSAAVQAGQQLGDSSSTDGNFVASIKALIADMEADLKAVHVIK